MEFKTFIKSNIKLFKYFTYLCSSRNETQYLIINQYRLYIHLLSSVNISNDLLDKGCVLGTELQIDKDILGIYLE